MMVGLLTLLHSERPKLYAILAFLSALGLRCMGIPPCFSTIVTKGNNFCDFMFAYLDIEAFTKWGLLSKEQILLTADPYREGQQN